MRVGLDVGGTKVDAVSLDDAGHVRRRVRRATGQGDAALVASVVSALEGLAEANDVSLAAFESVGIGIPGLVEPGTAVVRHAVNLAVTELDLADALAPVLRAVVRVENDVKAAALGAHALRAERGDAGGSLGYLNLGTGVAAGIVVDGSLWSGSRGGAGEIGHLTIDPAGPRCRCGQHGCVEVFAGGGALAERWGRDAEHPVVDLFDAADAGDRAAAGIRTGMVRAVAAAVRTLVLTVDVDTVVVGGGLAALGDRLADPVRDALRAEGVSSPFIASLALAARMELLPPGSPAAALGAALVGARDNSKGPRSHG